MTRSVRNTTGGRRLWTRRVAPGAAVALLALAAVLATPFLSAARPVPDSFADLAEELTPAVVNVSTTQKVAVPPMFGAPGLPELPPGSPFEEFLKRFFGFPGPEGAPEVERTALGSGFLIDPAGYVVTNNHVIAEATEITVILQDETKLDARLVGRDPMTDLALLKVEADRPLPAVSFGDSDRVRVGDWVLAIGNPFGLGGSVTAGIISARARSIGAGPYDDFLQTDASINRGNSGGPLFNTDGAVIGVATAIFSPTGTNIGIGFAIPSNLAQPVLAQLKETGRVTRGWLGVQIQQVTDDIAASLGLEEPAGALVAKVFGDSPAAAAGFAAGDVIVRFDGAHIDTWRTLPRLVAATRVGKRVAVEVIRGGERRTLEATVGRLEEEQEMAALGAPPSEGPLGLTLGPLTPEARMTYQIAEDVQGVVITNVAPGSAAARAGLQPGDVIEEIGQERVSSAEEVARIVERAKDGGQKAVLILVNRGGEPRFVAAPLGVG